MRRFQLALAALPVAICALVLAACGDSNGGGSASTTSTATDTTASGSPSASKDQVLDYAAYVGGKGKADTKLSPITIGWVNTQGGPPTLDFPMATKAVKAAVDMVNNELGGIHGHPLKLVTCFVPATKQDGQKCGQRFASDNSLKEVIGGLVAVGSDGVYSALGGKVPFVGSLAIIPADYNAKNAVFLSGSNTSAFGPYATYLQQAHKDAKKVAVIYITNPGADQIAKTSSAGYTKVGLQSSLVPYPASATDLTAPATIASSADVLVPTVTDPPSCVNLAKAFQQINLAKPVLSNPLCLALPPSGYPGGDYPKWTFGVAGVNLADAGNPEVQLYLKTSAKYRLKPADALFAYSGIAWGQVLATAKVMNQLSEDELTPDALAKAWKDFKGPVPLGAPTLDCSGGLVPGQPTACSNQATFSTYEGGGKWKVAQPEWLGPPK
jgi:branched-chain amino acid transport system substrate-binding protein